MSCKGSKNVTIVMPKTFCHGANSAPSSRGMRKQCSQVGMALLSALTLVVIIVAIIASVSVNMHYALRRSAILTHSIQARAYADSAIDYAKYYLTTDSFRSDSDDATERWAQQLPAFEVEGGHVLGQVKEIGSRFNLAKLSSETALNNIVDEKGNQNRIRKTKGSQHNTTEVSNEIFHKAFEQAVFKRLWRLLGGDSRYAEAMIGLLETQPFSSVIGVFTAAGMKESEIQRLAPYFCYLPLDNKDKMNINFIPSPVFAAYFDIPLPRATAILQALPNRPIKTQEQLQDFAKRYGVAKIKVNPKQQNSPSVLKSYFGISSRYFKVIGQADIGEAHVGHVVTVDRNQAIVTYLSKRLSLLNKE